MPCCSICAQLVLNALFAGIPLSAGGRVSGQHSRCTAVLRVMPAVMRVPRAAGRVGSPGLSARASRPSPPAGRFGLYGWLRMLVVSYFSNLVGALLLVRGWLAQLQGKRNMH